MKKFSLMRRQTYKKKQGKMSKKLKQTRKRKGAGKMKSKISRPKTSVRNTHYMRSTQGTNTKKVKTNTANQSLLQLLADCKEKSNEIRNAIENSNRRRCKFDKSCYRENLLHRLSFKHSGENLRQLEIDAYRSCTDKYLELSWKLFTNNGEQLPNEWYIAIGTYLQTWDYTDQHSLYFNILANICQHGHEYTNMYSKKFIEFLLVGMEESAVTGMFDITNRPELMKCLVDIKSPDDRYLSNTALLSLTKNK